MWVKTRRNLLGMTQKNIEKVELFSNTSSGAIFSGKHITKEFSDLKR